MKLTDGKVFHIYNRGNQQQKIFFSEDNYLFFMRKMQSGLLPFCDLLAYCLMPNHFHWLLRIKSVNEFSETEERMNAEKFSKAAGILLRSYTRAIQRQQIFTGSLFQQNTQSKILSDRDDVLTCFNYIHDNPVKAGLAAKASEWKFSSAAGYKNTFHTLPCNAPMLYELADINEKYDVDSYNASMFTPEKIERIS